MAMQAISIHDIPPVPQTLGPVLRSQQPLRPGVPLVVCDLWPWDLKGHKTATARFRLWAILGQYVHSAGAALEPSYGLCSQT